MMPHRLLSAILAAALLTGSAAGAAADPADDAGETREKTRQVLAYGIDSQVLEVIKRLKATRDAGYTPELAALLETSRSGEVRTAVLEMFGELGIRDGEAAARSIIAGWETGAPGVTSAAAVYLAGLHAEGLAALLLPLVDADDAVVCLSALRAIGASRDPAAVEPLLARLASVEFPEARKGDVVVALGELRDARALEALMRIAKGRDEDKTRRLYAADALGKIGDPRALPVLKSLFGEDDALLRAYAASALAAFGPSEALPTLLAGLRDENVRVRLQCTRGLARELGPAEASRVVPIVSWKAQNDPDRAVRLESLRTLGVIADSASVAFLESVLKNQMAGLEVREAALSALLVRSSAAPAIRAAVEQELHAKDAKPIEMMARVLSLAKSPDIGPVLVRLLDCSGYGVRILALRGLAANGVSGALARVTELSEKDPVAAVRAEAARTRDRLAPNPGAPTSSGR